MKRSPVFDIYRGYDSRKEGPVCYRWRLFAANGEIVAQGEGYTRRADCLRAVKRIIKLAGTATIKVLK